MEAEITKNEALAQEREATKLKLDNQAIKDEAEADLSTCRNRSIRIFFFNPASKRI